MRGFGRGKRGIMGVDMQRHMEILQIQLPVSSSARMSNAVSNTHGTAPTPDNPPSAESTRKKKMRIVGIEEQRACGLLPPTPYDSASLVSPDHNKQTVNDGASTSSYVPEIVSMDDRAEKSVTGEKKAVESGPPGDVESQKTGSFIVMKSLADLLELIPDTPIARLTMNFELVDDCRSGMADPVENPNPPGQHDPPAPPVPELSSPEMAQFVQQLYHLFSGASGSALLALMASNAPMLQAPVLPLPSSNPLPHADPGPLVPSNHSRSVGALPTEENIARAAGADGIVTSQRSTDLPSTVLQSSLLVGEENVPKSASASDLPPSLLSEHPESSLHNQADTEPQVHMGVESVTDDLRSASPRSETHSQAAAMYSLVEHQEDMSRPAPEAIQLEDDFKVITANLNRRSPLQERPTASVNDDVLEKFQSSFQADPPVRIGPESTAEHDSTVLLRARSSGRPTQHDDAGSRPSHSRKRTPLAPDGHARGTSQSSTQKLPVQSVGKRFKKSVPVNDRLASLRSQRTKNPEQDHDATQRTDVAAEEQRGNDSIDVQQRISSSEPSPQPSAEIVDDILAKFSRGNDSGSVGNGSTDLSSNELEDDSATQAEGSVTHSELSDNEPIEDDMLFLCNMLSSNTYRFPADLFDGIALLLLWAISRWMRSLPFRISLIQFYPKSHQDRKDNFCLLETLLGVEMSTKTLHQLTTWNKSNQVQLSWWLSEVRRQAFGTSPSYRLVQDHPKMADVRLCRQMEKVMEEGYTLEWRDHKKESYLYVKSPAVSETDDVVLDYFEKGEPALSEESIIGYIQNAMQSEVYTSIGELRDGVAYAILRWLMVRDVEAKAFAYTDIQTRTVDVHEGRLNLLILLKSLEPEHASLVDVERLLKTDPEYHRRFAEWFICEVLEGRPSHELIQAMDNDDAKELRTFYTWLKLSRHPPSWHVRGSTPPNVRKPQTARAPSSMFALARSNRQSLSSPGTHHFSPRGGKEDVTPPPSIPTPSSLGPRRRPCAMKSVRPEKPVARAITPPSIMESEENLPSTSSAAPQAPRPRRPCALMGVRSPPGAREARMRFLGLEKTRVVNPEEVVVESTPAAKRRRSKSVSASRKRVKDVQESEEAPEPELPPKSGKEKKKKKKPVKVKEDKSFSWHPEEGEAGLRTDKAITVLKKVIKEKLLCFEMACCGRMFFGGTSANPIRHLVGLKKNSKAPSGKIKPGLACEKFRLDGATRLRYLLHILPKGVSTQFHLVGDGSVVGAEARTDITPLRVSRDYFYPEDDAKVVRRLDKVVRDLIERELLTTDASDDAKIQQVDQWRAEQEAKKKAKQEAIKLAEQESKKSEKSKGFKKIKSKAKK